MARDFIVFFAVEIHTKDESTFYEGDFLNFLNFCHWILKTYVKLTSFELEKPDITTYLCRYLPK